MFDLPKAKARFEREFPRFRALAEELEARPDAHDLLGTLDAAPSPSPARDLAVLISRYMDVSPPWSEVQKIVQRMWPPPWTTLQDKMPLGEEGLALVVEALASAEYTSLGDWKFAGGLCLVLGEELRGIKERLDQPLGAEAVAPPRPLPAVRSPAKPAQPAFPLTPAEEVLPFALPPSRSATAEPAAQAGPVVVDEGAPPQDDFGGGFDVDEEVDLAERAHAGGVALADVEGELQVQRGVQGEEVVVEDEEEEEEDEDEEEEGGGDSSDAYNSDSDGGHTSSDLDSDGDCAATSASRKRSRAPVSTTARTRQSRNPLTPDATEEASALRDSPHNATPGPSGERAFAPSPSPAKKPRLAVQAALAVTDPFDPASWGVARIMPPARVAALLSTGYVRQPTSDLKNVSFHIFPNKTFTLSHTDIGGGNASTIGLHLCLGHEQNLLPSQPGEPFFVVFSSQDKLDKTRLKASSGSLSLFVRKPGVLSAWFYYGEIEEVESKSGFLRGGAPFLTLPLEQQHKWVDFLDIRLNVGSAEARGKARDLALKQWSLKLATNHTSKSALRLALEQQTRVEIPWSVWRCKGFDEAKLATWQEAVQRRNRFVRMLDEDVPADEEFLEACRTAIAKKK
ncbi:hypothetical protein JCM10207_007183 [Rhodosporidiobolus poonsookiae]